MSSQETAPATRTASSDTANPLPQFSSLDLTLSRDQGTLHSAYGAGSEATTLSHVAISNHEVLGPRILSQSSLRASGGGGGNGGALSPENLPQAPTDLPSMPSSGTNTPTTVADSSAVPSPILSSTNTPTPSEKDGGGGPEHHSRIGTPDMGMIAHSGDKTGTGGVGMGSSAMMGPPSSSLQQQPQHPSQAGLPPPIQRQVSTSSTSGSTTGTIKKTGYGPSGDKLKPLGEKKSVFGKIFERNNSSNVSISSSTGATIGAGTSTGGLTPGSSTPFASAPGGEGMDKSDPLAGAVVNGTSTPPLVRRASTKDARKQEEKERKAEEKLRKEREKDEKHLKPPRSVGEGSPALPSGDFAGAGPVNGATSRQRSPSRGAATSSATSGNRSRAGSAASHYGEKEEKSGGMGQALNDFMRNKVQRKGSVTSKQGGGRSDDGKSGAGSQADGASQYGGSTKGDDNKSRAGSNASLLKKYGVCEKVVIGKGATAVVKLAHKWDRSTERLYAVKEFRKRRKNETEKEYVKKLTSEFCISSTLHHHNIVETVDLVQDEQNHWCEVMEYCPGGDLYAAIKKGDMSAPEINSYFKQILSGVGYLHSMGVAHRDIKPENLLLDAKGHVKITDFGVSDVFRMCWEKTTHLSKGLCGSEPYIAPEQFEQKEYDARLVDVWACAIVFYCMHFQELPWRVAKTSDPSFGPYLELYSMSTSPPPLGNLVPRECRQIIKKMLDPNPKTRVTTETIENDPWFKEIEIIPPLEGVLTSVALP